MAETATERAHAYTKERILDGRFAGGEILSEGDVAREINLSRTPVREAFLQLEAEGLLRLYPRRGALVVPVSAREVEQVMEIRRLIETYAVEQVVVRQIDCAPELEGLLVEQRTLAEAGDGAAFVEADRRFHRLIVAATGNVLLTEFHDSLRDRQSRMGLAALARDRGRVEQILGEHERIVALVRGLDAGAAKDAMTAHLNRTLELLRTAPVGGFASD